MVCFQISLTADDRRVDHFTETCSTPNAVGESVAIVIQLTDQANGGQPRRSRSDVDVHDALRGVRTSGTRARKPVAQSLRITQRLHFQELSVTQRQTFVGQLLGEFLRIFPIGLQSQVGKCTDRRCVGQNQLQNERLLQLLPPVIEVDSLDNHSMRAGNRAEKVRELFTVLARQFANRKLTAAATVRPNGRRVLVQVNPEAPVVSQRDLQRNPGRRVAVCNQHSPRRQHNSCRRSLGFTLVEVLVVIAIIGILVAISLPAINAAREAARRSSCGNNLKELATAISIHEENHKAFPTGGWGANWIGDPDAGFGPTQPGGWIYNVLPYIEEKALRDVGKSLTSTAKRAAMVELLQTPVPIFNCPSRRLPRTYPYTGPSPLQNCDPPSKVAKSDYAINVDVSYMKSECIASNIQHKRGFSKTLLLGEKAISQDHYQDGQCAGDTLTMYVGDSSDIRRTASGSPVDDTNSGNGFGGPHSGCNVVMCDGAVRFVASTENIEP